MIKYVLFYFFFFNDTATTEIYTPLYTLSLHDALPISEKLALARYFHARLSELDGWDAGPAPDLSVVAFRYLPKNGDVDEFNEHLIRHIQQEGRVMLSGTRIDGSFRLRCAILCFRTHLEHVDDCLDALLRGV